VAGQPFLGHLFELLASRGVSDVLVLAGYRANQITDFCRSNPTHDLKVKVLEGADELTTAERLCQAAPHLHDEFLLLYCDNYFEFSPSKLRQLHIDKVADITFTLVSKPEGNVAYDPLSNRVTSYSQDRSSVVYPAVEVGFMLVNKIAFLKSLSRTQDVPATFVDLTVQGKVFGSFSHAPYWSISDQTRLIAAGEALSRKKILLLDRDGVLNERAPMAQYIKRPEDVVMISDTCQALTMLASKGFKFIVISNQAGVGRGVMSKIDVELVNNRIKNELESHGVEILDFFVCPHAWDEGCLCRKPAPGLFYEAAKRHKFLLEHVAYVGDDERDVLAATAAGVLPVLLKSVPQTPSATEGFQSSNLIDLVNPLLDFYAESRRREVSYI
jgi:D-glycero-D-manno-heptose 1,7-bisphosphate phosphatase